MFRAAEVLLPKQAIKKDFLSEVFFSLKELDGAVGEAGHDGGGDADAHEDHRKSLSNFQVQQRRHQSAGPGAGTGQRDRHQDQKAPGAVFFHRFALALGPPFQPGDETVQRGPMSAQPGEDTLDVYDDERNGDHVAQDRGGQSRKVRKPQGDPVGQAEPQLHHGYHGDEKGNDELAKRCSGEPGDHRTLLCVQDVGSIP